MPDKLVQCARYFGIVAKSRLLSGPIYIGIVGSRRRDAWGDFEKVLRALMTIYHEGDYLVSGGCKKGADRFMEDIAKRFEIPDERIIIFKPREELMDPTKHRRWEYGRICKLRNTDVARISDVLIACVADDRTGGTEDTITKFTKFHREGELILV